MPKRILVLSASVGAGHMRAAEAVELALRETAPADAIIKNVDVLSLTNVAFRRVYGTAYLDLVNKAPHVLGYFYDMMDRPRGARSKRDRLRLIVEHAADDGDDGFRNAPPVGERAVRSLHHRHR
jgi:processive 1,2-diacylglycerol beta-glucosyltransferase